MSIYNQSLEILTNNANQRQYAMDFGTFYSIIDEILDGTISDYSVVSETGAFSFKSSLLQNDSDYFVNFQWFPFDMNKLFTETTVTSFNLGKKTGITGHTLYSLSPVSLTPFKKWFSFSISRIHNNFLDFAPYTQLTLYVPFFNKFTLDPQTVYGKTIDGYIVVDRFTGNATLYLFVGNNFYDSRSCKISIDIPFGATNEQEQRRNNLLQMITIGASLMGTIYGMETGNPLITAGSFGSLAKNVNQAIQNNVDRMSGYKGGTGTRDNLACDRSIVLITETPQDIKFPNRSLRGGVCKENYTLSLLSGYTQVGNINFDPSGYEIYNDEISEIVELLKSGVIL